MCATISANQSAPLHEPRNLLRNPLLLGVLCLWLAACGGPAAPGEQSARYPEKRRPEPARSASDDQVLGAHGQDPGATLDNSATPERLAPGWAIEGGKLVRHPEVEPDSHGTISSEACPKPPGAGGTAATPPAGAPARKRGNPCPPPNR